MIQNVLTNPRDVDIHHLTTNAIAGNVYHKNNTIIGGDADLNSRLDPIPDASFARNKTTSPPDSECLPGTREGVLETITAWADKSISSTPSHVYWLYGYAGCGKSSILQAVAERFHKEGRLAASFFFFRSSDRRSRFKSVPATLASQLAEAIPATAPLILGALKADFGLLSKSIGAQMECLVYRPLKTVTKWYRLGAGATAVFKGPFLITIDGLDECEDKKDVEQFIDHMVSYFRDHPKLPLRFCIASRVEEHIRARLVTDQVFLDNLANHSPDQDITAFILARFARAAKDDRIVQAYGPSWPKSTDIHGLAKLGKGSFIFVSMLLKYIFETIDDGLTPMQRLPRALETTSNLDGLYASTLSRSEHLPHFSSVISTLACLRTPLPTSSIAELLNIELYEVIAVLVNLQAIIQLPGDDITPVTLCHSSLQDFLTIESRSAFFPFLHPINHEDMAYRCLDLLIRHRRTKSGLRYAYTHVSDHLVLASKALHYDRHYYNRVVTDMNQQFPTSFPLVLSTHLTMQGPGGWNSDPEPLVDFCMPKFPQSELELIARVITTLPNHPNAREVLASRSMQFKQSFLAPDVTDYTLAKQCIQYLLNPWLLERCVGLPAWTSTLTYILVYWAKHLELAVIHDPAMDLNVFQEDLALSSPDGLPKSSLTAFFTPINPNVGQMQENIALAVEAIQNKFPGTVVSNLGKPGYWDDYDIQMNGPVSVLVLLNAFQQFEPDPPFEDVVMTRILTLVGEGVVINISGDYRSGNVVFTRRYS